MKKMLHWIGFHVGYWYARLFICPFPKRREAYLNKIKNLTGVEIGA